MITEDKLARWLFEHGTHGLQLDMDDCTSIAIGLRSPAGIDALHADETIREGIVSASIRYYWNTDGAGLTTDE